MAKLNKIPFKQKEVKKHLDKLIRYWRKVKLDKTDPLSDCAMYYVDAYQSIRTSLFGNTLK